MAKRKYEVTTNVHTSNIDANNNLVGNWSKNKRVVEADTRLEAELKVQLPATLTNTSPNSHYKNNRWRSEHHATAKEIKSNDKPQPQQQQQQSNAKQNTTSSSSDGIEDGVQLALGLVFLPLYGILYAYKSYQFVKAFRNGEIKPKPQVKTYKPTPAEIAAQKERVRKEKEEAEKQRLKEHHDYWKPKIAEGYKNIRILNIMFLVLFVLFAAFFISGEIYERYFFKG